MAALSLSSLIWLLLIIILFSTLEHSLSKRQQLWIPTTLIMTNKNDYLSVREAYSRHSKENMKAGYIRLYVYVYHCAVSVQCAEVVFRSFILSSRGRHLWLHDTSSCRIKRCPFFTFRMWSHNPKAEMTLHPAIELYRWWHVATFYPLL